MAQPRATEVRYSPNVEDGRPGFYLADAVTGEPITAVPNVNIQGSHVVAGGLLTFGNLDRAREIAQISTSHGLDTTTPKPDPRVHPPGCRCYYCL